MKIGPNPDSLHPDDERTAFRAILDFQRSRASSPYQRICLQVLADRLCTICAKISTLEAKNAELNSRLVALEPPAQPKYAYGERVEDGLSGNVGTIVKSHPEDSELWWVRFPGFDKCIHEINLRRLP